MDKEQLWTLTPMAGVLVLGIFFALAMPRKTNEEPEQDEEDDDDDDDDED